MSLTIEKLYLLISNSRYVSNAQVEDNLDKAQLTLTNYKGEFTLKYVGVPENTSVYFQITKPSTNLEVVNFSDLKAITGQKEVVKITMASKQKIADYRKLIYRIGKTASEKQLEEILNSKNHALTELKKNLSKNSNEIRNLEIQLKNLEEQRKKIEENAIELTQRYSVINLDDASPIFRKAFDLFQKGELDSALFVLKKVDLASKVYEILNERKKIIQLQSEIIHRDSVQEKRSADIAETLKFKADIHKILYEYDSTLICYELLVNLDSSNDDYLFDYANFLAWINQYTKAANIYLQILSKHSNDSITNYQSQEIIASVLENLGNVYSAQNKFDQAENAFLHSAEIAKKLIQYDFLIFKPFYASVLMNLADLYTHMRQYQKSENLLLESLEIRRKLTNQNFDNKAQISSILNNLGIIYTKLGDWNKAEFNYTQSLLIKRQLSQDDTSLYKSEMIYLLNNLGNLYIVKGDFEKASNSLSECLEIVKHLTKSNSVAYNVVLGDISNSLCILYDTTQQYSLGEKACLEALYTRKMLVQDDSAAFAPDLALTETNVAILYGHMQLQVEAEDHFLKAIEIRKKLALKYPKIYNPDVAESLNNLGIFYLQNHELIKGEKTFIEAIEIYKRLLEGNHHYELNLSHAFVNLGNLYFLQGNQTKAEESFNEAKKIMH